MLIAIRDTVSGQFILPIAVAAKLATRLSQIDLNRSLGTTVDQRIRLTERERDIAELVVKGYNNRDIAAALFISEGTVRNYMSNLYSKIGVMDRLQASIRLRELLAHEGHGMGK
ncbi:Spore germination protein GerE [compost metagenome]